MGLNSVVVEVFVTSVRDGYVQVSAFVAVTVLLFSYVQYRTDGRFVAALSARRELQPLAGAVMGLTPGCGGAIVVMPLYVRGTVSFGTVVATLAATAGDSAFVILALAPEAALYAYGLAFLAAVGFGYLVDWHGLGVSRVDAAVSRLSRTSTDGGVLQTAPTTGSDVHHYDGAGCATPEDQKRPASVGPWRRRLSETALALWWVAAVVALVAGVLYLLRGAPDVPVVLAPTYAGAFTVAGILGTTLSVYLYVVGRHDLGHGAVGAGKDTFETVRETLTHAAMETSFVTVWVVVAYLLYEYGLLFTGIDLQTVAAAAGVLAPIGGAVVGLVPGCGPQIVLAAAYAEGSIPFSALTANAISQDGDALFPLLAIDKTAAVVASVYTTVPALVVGVGLHLLYGPMFGFGVLG
ncbi:putative manganese transporter [Halospeciosus flavus]|uniref:Manganese transporter n=1 Tax=Halospeciosus flavus TaxID=3032283 RepID=A0ABD5YZ11_9EURY|nr:putative manganese transporter [Halospeciosus flavus]